MAGALSANEEEQRLLDERRRVSLQELASVWGFVLDLFLLSLLLAQLAGLVVMASFLPFLAGVSIGNEILRRISEEQNLTPARLDRDCTIMSLLVFISTLGMPREFMPACYMARTLCFSFTCSRLSNKVNVMLAPFYVSAHWITRSPASDERVEFHIFSEVIAVSFMTLLMTTLDTKEHKLAQASVALEIKARDLLEAEREGSAAQRLLSVTCDASVRLTKDLEIQTSSTSLADLLMCHFSSGRSLEGMPFAKYIASEDQQRFKDFLAESAAAAPARSLHVNMKDSSGVLFAAELFHVTVPSFSDGLEHLIGVSSESSSADRVGRMESMCSDMRHVLGLGLDRLPSSLSSHSRSTSSSQKCYKHLTLLRSIGLIVQDCVENGFLIREATFHFSDEHSCQAPLLPNLLEWLKPKYRQRMLHCIEAVDGSLSRDLNVLKGMSPFPGSSELRCEEVLLNRLAQGAEPLLSVHLNHLSVR